MMGLTENLELEKVHIKFDKKDSFFCNKSIQYIQCAVCLNVLNNPFECLSCDTLICHLCLQVLDVANMKCFGKCKGSYKKANKYLREALTTLTITCKTCSEEMSYSSYFNNAHCTKCLPDLLLKDKYQSDFNEKDELINKLEGQIKSLAFKRKMYNRFNYTKLLQMPMDQLRQTLMSFNLPIEKKMELYYACTNGNLSEFEKLITKKKYPLLEEISYKDFYWTPLHYAMHYGQYRIISYILNILKEENIMEPAMRLQSSDARCPLMCLLKSNHLDSEKKEEIFEKLLKDFNVTLSKEVKKEALGRGYDHILKKYNKNS